MTSTSVTTLIFNPILKYENIKNKILSNKPLHPGREGERIILISRKSEQRSFELENFKANLGQQKA